MSDPRPDLEQLRLLVGIADHESLGAAARSLGIAQPNASRMLRRLERQLRLSLVVRSPTGSRLTTQGQVVVQWAREVTEATGRLVAGAKALAAETNAQLSIAASMTIAEYLVPRWLSEFRLLDVPVRVNLTVCNSHDVFERIEQGGCDLGFVESPGVPRGLRSMVVGRDELVVVVGPSHPWARRRRPVTAEELAATPLIVRESGSGTRISLEHHLAGHVLVEPAVELSSNAAVKVMASGGVAPAVLSTLAVAAALEAGELVAVPVEDLRLTRRLRAVWRGELTAPSADFVRVAGAGLRPHQAPSAPVRPAS
jgi:DNA-binding transcriptional LysR family regulator